MRLMFVAIVLSLFMAAALFAVIKNRQPTAHVAASTYGGETVWLQTPTGRLKALVFRGSDVGRHPRLIVVLHGDAPFDRPGYQYRFAASAARAMDEAVVAAILRPGYTDPTGDKSDGERGMTTGDNYTPAVVDAIDAGVRQLAQTYHADGVTLVGHSGGAAISANIMERHPDLASRALLVSCPCDLAAWRHHMGELQHNPIWSAQVASLSPIEHVDQLSHEAHLVVMVGASDDIAPPALSQAFAEAARAHAGAVDLVVLPDLPHDILLERKVLAGLRQLEHDD